MKHTKLEWTSIILVVTFNRQSVSVRQIIFELPKICMNWGIKLSITNFFIIFISSPSKQSTLSIHIHSWSFYIIVIFFSESFNLFK
jgi:hypothetical protein